MQKLIVIALVLCLGTIVAGHFNHLHCGDGYSIPSGRCYRTIWGRYTPCPYGYECRCSKLFPNRHYCCPCRSHLYGK